MALNAASVDLMTLPDIQQPSEKNYSCLTQRCSQLNEIALDNFEEAALNTNRGESKRHCWLLSLDGGGIRGIMHLYALVKLECITKKSVIDLFDGIAGTSIGGVIACLLTLPDPNDLTRPLYSAKSVLKIMLENRADLVEEKWQSFGGIFGTHYKTRPVKNLLYKLFGENNFKNRLLPTVLVTHDLHSFAERLISTTDEQDFYTKDVAMATAAAPTYYKAQYVSTIDQSDEYLLSDGGTAMNNPTLAGIALLQQYYGAPMKNIHVFSLGTGTAGEQHSDNFLCGGGCFDWALEIADLCIDGQLSVIDSTAKLYLGNRYYRFDPYLEKGNVRLDDVSDNYIRILKAATSKMLKFDGRFNQLVSALETDSNEELEPGEENKEQLGRCNQLSKELVSDAPDLAEKEENSVAIQVHFEKHYSPLIIEKSEVFMVVELSYLDRLMRWIADLCCERNALSKK